MCHLLTRVRQQSRVLLPQQYYYCVSSYTLILLHPVLDSPAMLRQVVLASEERAKEFERFPTPPQGRSRAIVPHYF